LLTKYGAKREIAPFLVEEGILDEMQHPDAGPWLNAYFADIPVFDIETQKVKKMDSN
jgi:hypothetical protein